MNSDPCYLPTGEPSTPVLLFPQQVVGLPGPQSHSDTHMLWPFVQRTAQGTPSDPLRAETSPNASAQQPKADLWVPPPIPSTSVSSCLEKPEATKRIHLCSTNS